MALARVFYRSRSLIPRGRTESCKVFISIPAALSVQFDVAPFIHWIAYRTRSLPDSS